MVVNSLSTVLQPRYQCENKVTTTRNRTRDLQDSRSTLLPLSYQAQIASIAGKSECGTLSVYIHIRLLELDGRVGAT